MVFAILHIGSVVDLKTLRLFGALPFPAFRRDLARMSAQDELIVGLTESNAIPEKTKTFVRQLLAFIICAVMLHISQI